MRGLGALVILIPSGGGRRAGGHTDCRDLKWLFLLGLGVLGNHLLTLFGLRYVGAATAGVIIGASPAITALLSSLLVRDVPFTTVAGGCASPSPCGAGVRRRGRCSDRGDNPLAWWLVGAVGIGELALYSIGGRQEWSASPLTVNWTTLSLSLMLQIPCSGPTGSFWSPA